MPPPSNVHNTGVSGLTYDKSNGGRWRWRNKISGKSKTWPINELERAKKEAQQLNDVVAMQEAAEAVKRSMPVTVGQLIDMYRVTKFERRALGKQTRKNYAAQLERYKREFGSLFFNMWDRSMMQRWLDDLGTTSDTYNGHRDMFIHLCGFAINRGLADYNEAEATEKREMSEKIDGNKKKRQSIKSLDEFWMIHKAAPPFIQTAMELCLLTLQGGQELVEMSTHNTRDGYLYVIRQKTRYQSDLAFIALELSDEHHKVFAKARKSEIVCPYYIHHKPQRRQNPAVIASKAHPFCISRDFLSKQYAKARDAAGLWNHLPSVERPGMHENRGFAGRLLLDAGYTAEQIQAYYGHGKKSVSDRYLADPNGISDSDFVKVPAPTIRIQDMK